MVARSTPDRKVEGSIPSRVTAFLSFLADSHGILIFCGTNERRQGCDFIKGSFFFHEIPMKFHEKQAFH